jgi:hypothetical protein
VDHCLHASGPMRSLYALVMKDGEDVEKLTQGDNKIAPARGVEREIVGIGIADEG